ncbi:hypothetical protein QVD17_03837 [Tagetes erecta]|uniref:Uncharacterized protein n=1 Tax=Tagetes erecta TaxID=13708 RepID=A0AAD8LF49_TARER|nr:hypothetical protein QVD17_03837 [Tagetes erecta]
MKNLGHSHSSLINCFFFLQILSFGGFACTAPSLLNHVPNLLFLNLTSSVSSFDPHLTTTTTTTTQSHLQRWISRSLRIFISYSYHQKCQV